MRRFIRRFFGVLALLPYVYEDVEADHRAFPQALTIVGLSALATGAAYWDEFGVRGLAGGLFAALVGWLIWAWLTYYIGSQWLPEATTEADWGELLRTTGFAVAPGTMCVFGMIREARDPILLIATLWILVGFVLAVRQALDYQQTWRAVVVCLAGAIIYLGLIFIVPRGCQLEAVAGLESLLLPAAH